MSTFDASAYASTRRRDNGGRFATEHRAEADVRLGADRAPDIQEPPMVGDQAMALASAVTDYEDAAWLHDELAPIRREHPEAAGILYHPGDDYSEACFTDLVDAEGGVLGPAELEGGAGMSNDYFGGGGTTSRALDYLSHAESFSDERRLDFAELDEHVSQQLSEYRTALARVVLSTPEDARRAADSQWRYDDADQAVSAFDRIRRGYPGAVALRYEDLSEASWDQSGMRVIGVEDRDGNRLERGEDGEFEQIESTLHPDNRCLASICRDEGDHYGVLFDQARDYRATAAEDVLQDRGIA